MAHKEKARPAGLAFEHIWALFGLQFTVYCVFLPKLGPGHCPYLSEANINEMDLERHPQYRRSAQIFRLTLGCPGRPSFLWKMGTITAFLGFVLVAGTGATAAQEAPKSSAGNETEISIRRTDCRALVQYTDTDAASYKPGVDVNGRPVAGANVSDAGASIVPAEITFTLTLRLADFVPGLAAGLADTTAPIGEILVRGQDVFLNGRALNQRQSQVLTEQCRANLEGSATE